MSLILIINASEATGAIRGALERSGPVTEFDHGTYLRVGAPTEKIDGWLGVMEDENIEKDYDPSVLSKLTDDLGTIRFFILEGKDGARELSKKFITNFEPGVRAVIDDTRGNIVSITHAKKAIDEGNYWISLSD